METCVVMWGKGWSSFVFSAPPAPGLGPISKHKHTPATTYAFQLPVWVPDEIVKACQDLISVQSSRISHNKAIGLSPCGVEPTRHAEVAFPRQHGPVTTETQMELGRINRGLLSGAVLDWGTDHSLLLPWFPRGFSSSFWPLIFQLLTCCDKISQ